ncbi:MAG TPA: hypothetical protein VN603_06070 [Candidatus Acidoferrales bacterium]|nr:hypothetical protein [Candidatus Acidoferrales bacterium]
MIQTHNAVRLEYGIYRDGDNNLDDAQSATIGQALQTSGRDRAISFAIEDTTARRGLLPEHYLRTESYDVDGGHPHNLTVEPPKDMSARATLASFVARTLDAAQKHHAAATWIELVDHGGGDAGGLESDMTGGFMAEDDIAGAIRDGIALHARSHPEDAGRRIDGVVANQCLMSTLGFADALSHAGVRYLAASPEVMLAPGVPSAAAEAIEKHLDDPASMADALTAVTMHQRYGEPDSTWHPAAAFDVLDLDPQKIAHMDGAVKSLNDAIVTGARDRSTRAEIRADAREVDGMARFTKHTMPWHADRPAGTLYGTFADDASLPDDLRTAARDARDAANDLVLSHRESADFQPYGDAAYSDATGPTVHLPLTRNQIDPWKPQVAETDNAFYKAVDGPQLARAVA